MSTAQLTVLQAAARAYLGVQMIAASGATHGNYNIILKRVLFLKVTNHGTFHVNFKAVQCIAHDDKPATFDSTAVYR